MNTPFYEDSPAETQMESLDNIRLILQQRGMGTIQEPQVDVDTQLFRPTRRPPMALVCILDDDGEEGEWIRIRRNRVLIGRTEGDIVISHDTAMSTKHAELQRQAIQDGYRWFLVDKQSTNGTFIRVSRALLRSKSELMLGNGRYRLELPYNNAVAGMQDNIPSFTGATQKEETPWSTNWPALVLFTPHGEKQRFLLQNRETFIGRCTTQCAIVVYDPLLSPVHAKILCDSSGRWFVENLASRNGTWVRVQKIPFGRTGQFQLGEQRFLVRIP